MQEEEKFYKRIQQTTEWQITDMNKRQTLKMIKNEGPVSKM